MKLITIARALTLTAAVALSTMASADTIKLKLATDSGAKGSPTGKALEHWADLIQKKTAGTPDAIKINIFYQDEMGDQKEVFDLFMAGEVDMMINWPLTSYDKRMGLRNTPYMILDWKQGFDAYRPGGWLNTIYKGVYKDQGLEFFGAWPEGFAGVATRGKYATTVEAAKGIKVRVPSGFPNPQTLQALGYQPASIAWGEVFTSIQTGVVDGEAGNIIYWDYEYFRDVLTHYTRIKHMFVTGTLAMNSASWKKLNANQQKIVADAATKVMEKQFADAKALDQSYVDKAIKFGMKYIEPTDAEIRALAKVAREKVWPQMEAEMGADIVNKIRENAPKL